MEYSDQEFFPRNHFVGLKVTIKVSSGCVGEVTAAINLVYPEVLVLEDIDFTFHLKT